MDQELPVLTLLNVGGDGAAEELVATEIERVLANVMDPATKASAKREIVLKIVFAPSKDREGGVVSLQVSSKLASPEGVGSSIFIGVRRGTPVATTFNPAQQQIDWDAQDRPAVIEQEGKTG